ncbi:MAG: site-2 protease family protein [Candidatus Nezhaarchaeales archaeon]
MLLGLSAFLGLWGIIALLYKSLGLKKYGFSLKPFLLIVKSRSLAKKFEYLGYSNSRSWKLVSNVGLFVSGGLMFFAFYFLITNLVTRFTVGQPQTGLYVVIPGITIGWHVVPYFIVAAAITIIVHEAFHAITFGNENVPVKSFGIFIAAILPGGLVEADEIAFKNVKPISKMRIYASGSFSNFVVFLLALALTVATIAPVQQGALVLETREGYPAHGVIKSWDVIVAINDNTIYSVNDFQRVLRNISPGTEIEVSVLRDGSPIKLSLVTAPSPDNNSRAILGVNVIDYYPSTVPWLRGEAYLHWTSTLYWLRLISFSVAMINMLPIPLLDGSGFVRALLENLFRGKKRACDIIANVLGTLTLFLFLANIILPVSTP